VSHSHRPGKSESFDNRDNQPVLIPLNFDAANFAAVFENNPHVAAVAVFLNHRIDLIAKATELLSVRLHLSSFRSIESCNVEYVLLRHFKRVSNSFLSRNETRENGGFPEEL
jgi:hypothetical protein